MKILTVDIGGTFLKYAIMNEEMMIYSKGKVKTPKEKREDLIETIGQIYDSEEVEGIAISMTGIIDSKNGYCYMGGALRYNDGFAFGETLQKRCPTRIHVENDAKCAGYIEAVAGALKDVDDGFALLFGTMIGGAYIKDKKLHKGKHFSAGEVSYIVTDRDQYADFDTIWGNRCGTPRLCADYQKETGLKDVDGQIFFDAVEEGDDIAKKILERYAKEIAVQIFNIQTVLDVERFAIGGGISARDCFIEAIRKNLKDLYEHCPYPITRVDVVRCAFENDANLYGALQCFLSAYPKGETDER